MNAQEIYNTVRDHLLAQGERALSDTNLDLTIILPSCRYRASNGNKCAIGCLISDAAYSETIEGMTADDPYVVSVLIKSGIDALAHLDLLTDLQAVHDSRCYEVEDWSKELAKVATRHHLTP